METLSSPSMLCTSSPCTSTKSCDAPAAPNFSAKSPNSKPTNKAASCQFASQLQTQHLLCSSNHLTAKAIALTQHEELGGCVNGEEPAADLLVGSGGDRDHVLRVHCSSSQPQRQNEDICIIAGRYCCVTCPVLKSTLPHNLPKHSIGTLSRTLRRPMRRGIMKLTEVLCSGASGHVSTRAESAFCATCPPRLTPLGRLRLLDRRQNRAQFSAATPPLWIVCAALVLYSLQLTARSLLAAQNPARKGFIG